MKIEIEYIENSNEEVTSGWLVRQGEKYSDGLGYDEVLGLVASLIIPEKRGCLQWLKTSEEHKAWRDNLLKKDDSSPEFEQVSEEV